ncbi:MAG: hypothetical protein E7243_23845 [Lacrimispora celerecrescens]|uniref:IclR family transcriptional regulator n=1 Tax=Lacrimispora indolis TaxID=69825 RepID=UPI00040964A5|nr:helix-turn-helix domain-containing protein [[Clostridium] methoxybenzovorans]MBE7722528.1 hypothetical protein [Lacrimispora celerecrescens]
MANRFEDKVASVSKALTILEVLSNEPEGLGLLEISSRVDMHKTTVYRLLTSLMEKNFVEQDEQTGRYSMGLKILSLANAFYEKVDIRIIIRKYISGLLAGEVSSSSEDQSSEEGFLLVSKRMEHNFVVMDCLEGGMLAPLRVGEVLAKESIIVKTCCANIAVWQQGKNMYPSGLTVKQEAEYRQELKNISIQGYGYSERDVGALPCAAAPVFDYSKNLVCVLSLHSISLEDQKVRSRKILDLMNTVNRISGELGYAGYL